MKERFLEALLQRTERELAGPGAPGSADEAGWQKVERREAQRPPSMGARGLVVPREVGPLIPPPRVPRKHSGASRRSIALARFARDWQSSDALRRENVEAWLFEIVDEKNEAHERATFTSVIARLNRATQYSAAPECHTNGGIYWFPAFAGMTILCLATTRLNSAR